MLTAKTSQRSGLLKLGHMLIWFGSGNIQYATQTRPTWIPGNVKAHMTAKMVIASAERLIEVRHFWRNRKRIAEISVPAWPIPIQNTKLVMYEPHITGWFRPMMPRPSHIWMVKVNSIIPRNVIATPRPIHQAIGGRRKIGAMTSTVTSRAVIEGWSSEPVGFSYSARVGRITAAP